MKRFLNLLLIFVACAVMFCCISVYTYAAAEFSGEVTELISIPAQTGDFEKNQTQIHGVYSYNDFLLVPITYRGTDDTARRNYIYVYDTTGEVPELYTVWDDDDLSVDKTRNNRFYGLEITDNGLYIIVRLQENGRGLGLLEYTNPLTTPEATPQIPQRLRNYETETPGTDCFLFTECRTASSYYATVPNI